MAIFYSASVGGFLDSEIHSILPADAVPLTAKEHGALLAAQRVGKVIQSDARGNPVALAPSRSVEATRTDLVALTKREAARRIDQVAPLWRQLNDARELPFAIGDARTAIEARHAAIDAIRTASDAIERQIASLGTRALARFTPTTSDHWPKEP
jgi:hypothetical protein